MTARDIRMALTSPRRPAPAPERARPERARVDAGSSVVLNGLAFFAPLLVFAEINLVGRLFITELLLLAALPVLLLTRGAMLARGSAVTVIVLLLLWFAGQVATDIARQTPFLDYSRGWAKIGFTTLNFMALYLVLTGSRQRIRLFVLGLALGGLLVFFTSTVEAAFSDPWKFIIGLPVTWLVVLVAQTAWARRFWPMPVVLMGMVGTYSMLMGSRALAGVTLMAAVFVMLQNIASLRRSSGGRALSPLRIALFLAFGLVASWGLLTAYETSAARGWLGTDAQEKLFWQKSSEYGLLLGGRSEILVSLEAIGDSPLLGHGSWAKNVYYAAQLQDIQSPGSAAAFLVSDTDLIPTHSHLFGAWVEAGILGVPIWLFALWLVVRALSNVMTLREPIVPLVALFGFMLLWDIIFSPFGADRRIVFPFVMVVLLMAGDRLRRPQVQGAEAYAPARRSRIAAARLHHG